jgi:hypothetical protein
LVEAENPNPNLILTLDRQSHPNPLNWIAIRIEQSNNPIQQYPDTDYVVDLFNQVVVNF